MFHNDMRTQNVIYTVQPMTKSTNTDNHLTTRHDKQEKMWNEQDRDEQDNSPLWEFCSNSVGTKSKLLPPNRCSTHHVLNFLHKNVFPPAVCPDRRYTHHGGRSGLWRYWNENRNITSQINTRAKLQMTRKESKFLMQSENSIFLLDSI